MTLRSCQRNIEGERGRNLSDKSNTAKWGGNAQMRGMTAAAMKSEGLPHPHKMTALPVKITMYRMRNSESECATASLSGIHAGVAGLTVVSQGGGRHAEPSVKKRYERIAKVVKSANAHCSTVVATCEGRGRFWRAKGASEQGVGSVDMKRFRIKYVSTWHEMKTA